MEDHISTEKSVLEVYRRASPSYKDIGRPSIRERVFQQRISVLEKLGLHQSFLNKGSAAFFNMNLLHRGGLNLSSLTRYNVIGRLGNVVPFRTQAGL